MPVERTGYVEENRRADGTKYYRARVRLADDSRERVDVPSKFNVAAGGMSAKERRALYAAAAQEREDETGELYKKKLARIAAKAAELASDGGETCSAFRVRLDDHREELGKGSRKDDESTWRAWIAEHLGPLPIAKVTREDVEKFRDVLDGEIRKHRQSGGAEGISPKRAINVWSCVTTTFRAAGGGTKRRDLRVREDNPCAGVLPPEDGEPRRKPFVYPRELAAVLGCLAVALEWREAFAIGSYLYLRPGELHALTWGDVDLEGQVAHVSKAWDERAKTIKAPKTRNGIREVPIPESLVPLLRRMRRLDDGTDRPGAELVCPIVAGTPESKRAPRFVAALRAAGVERSRLFENTATTMAANFRTLRDSGITWLALAGVDAVRMQRRAGHDDIKTTLDYVKQAEDIGGRIGEPFGPLPRVLLEGAMGQGDVPAKSRGRRPRYQPKYQPKFSGALRQKVKNPGLGQGFSVEAAGVEPASESGLSKRLRA